MDPEIPDVMAVDQAAVSRYCAAERKQEHRRAIQELVRIINSVHAKLERAMSGGAGAEREAAQRAHGPKTDACGAPFVLALPHNHTHLEESRSLVFFFLLLNRLMSNRQIEFVQAEANRAVKDTIREVSEGEMSIISLSFVSFMINSLMGLRDHMAAEETLTMVSFPLSGDSRKTCLHTRSVTMRHGGQKWV